MELRGFLGLSSYYRRFIQGYGKITTPLTTLLQKDIPYVRGVEANTTFHRLKKALTTAPVLILPKFLQSFTIETDALGIGIGAMLMQSNHPIAYISKTMGPKYQLLFAYEKEIFAILFIVKKVAALFFRSISGNKNKSKGFKAFAGATPYNNVTELGFGQAHRFGFPH